MPCCVYVHSYGHSRAGVVFTMNICTVHSTLKYMLTKYKKMLFELMLRTLKKKNREFEMIVLKHDEKKINKSISNLKGSLLICLAYVVLLLSEVFCSAIGLREISHTKICCHRLRLNHSISIIILA